MKKLIVRDYVNNVMKNKAGIHPAVIVIHLFQNIVFEVKTDRL